jgi:hypothetical protein
MGTVCFNFAFEPPMRDVPSHNETRDNKRGARLSGISVLDGQCKEVMQKQLYFLSIKPSASQYHHDALYVEQKSNQSRHAK